SRAYGRGRARGEKVEQRLVVAPHGLAALHPGRKPPQAFADAGALALDVAAFAATTVGDLDHGVDALGVQRVVEYSLFRGPLAVDLDPEVGAPLQFLVAREAVVALELVPGNRHRGLPGSGQEPGGERDREQGRGGAPEA